MGMGLLRWLLWPRRAKDDEDERPSKRFRPKPRPKSRHPGVYRIEVDNEVGRFHGDGAPFSFWSSSRVILILSFLLWWIQPAGPMIAGYVGGRRAGSPIKAVIAALMPVFAIYIANITYAHNFASHQIDFVATLPMVVSDAAASILPFLLPYKEFMVAYMQGFAQALTTTFGMGTNGYLMVVIFAYIGGLIAEQTRRELGSRAGSGSSVGVNLVQPLLGARPYVDDEEEAYEEDEEIFVHPRDPYHRVDLLATEGVGFAGYAVGAIGQEPKDPDLMAIPDPASFTPIPFIKDGLAIVHCDPHVSGEPWPYAPRVILKALIQRAADAGFEPWVGAEVEYFLLHRNADGSLEDAFMALTGKRLEEDEEEKEE